MHKTFGAHKAAHELRMHGFDVLVINYVDTFNLDELNFIVKHAVSDKTLFVGISTTFLGHLTRPEKFWYNCLLPQGYEIDCEFVASVKCQNPNCKIVVGGTRANANFHHPLVDYVVIGYADVSVVMLAQHLQYGAFIGVKNYRNIYGKTVFEDRLAESFDFNHSTMTWCDDDVIVPGEVLPLEVSRGCMFACKFCSYTLNGKKKLDYLKDFDIIHDELLTNYEKYGIKNYRLLDDTFNDHEEKIDIMLDIVKRLPFQPNFFGYVRLDILAAKPHTIPKLFDMGLRYMFLGIETFNKKSGSIIGKGGDPAKLVQTIVNMKKQYGNQITLLGSFICGLPGESKLSVMKTMIKLRTREIPLDIVLYRPLNIVRKTAHWPWDSAFDLDFEKYGYKDLEPESKYPYIRWQNAHMTKTEALEMTRDFHEKFTPNPTDHILEDMDKIIDVYKTQLRKHLDNVQP